MRKRLRHRLFRDREGLHLFCWDQGPLPDKWSCGWWTGADGDLLCVLPKLRNPLQNELALSPVCFNPLWAILCFVLKRLLIRLDHNVWYYFSDERERWLRQVGIEE